LQNVLNTLRVLEEVAARQPIGVGELARVLDMPKSSVQRALVTLHTAGWIRPAAGEVTRWVITTRALAVGGRASDDLDLRGAALPIMEGLRRQTEETIHLTIPEDGKMVLIERLETDKPVRTSMALGHALPLHASAMARRYSRIAVPRCSVRCYLTSCRVIPTRRSPTPTSCAPSWPRSGNGGSPSIVGVEVRRGLGCRSRHGGDEKPIASISVNIPMSRLTQESEADFGAAVNEAASSLSARLR